MMSVLLHGNTWEMRACELKTFCVSVCIVGRNQMGFLLIVKYTFFKISEVNNESFYRPT